MVVILTKYSKPFTGGAADEKGITGKEGCQGKKGKGCEESAAADSQ
jgi:hypothetical protein